MDATTITAPPSAEAIRHKLAAIRQHAEYLRHWSRGAEEHDAARSVQRLAREIEALLSQIGADA